MSELIIRDEIEKHATENWDIHINQPGVIIPSKQQLIDHIFTKNVDARNRFEDDTLLLKFKDTDGKELKVCIWELMCSSAYSYRFYGYCDFAYYGSGLFSNKEGYGMRLITGEFTFNEDGSPLGAYMRAMKEGVYHR